MDILVKTQATSDINLIVPLMINTGAPDTGAALTVKAINPDGTENTTFTQPTITEVIAASGVYKLVFAASANTKLFTAINQYNPYTVVIKSGTAGSTGYRAVRIYCVDRLPGDVSSTTEVAAVTSTTATNITNATTGLAVAATTASAANLATLTGNVAALAGVVALDSTVAKATALTTLSGLVALDSTVAKAATVALDSTVAKASAVTSMQTDVTFLKKVTKNRRTLSSAGSVYSLNVFDDDDSTPILTKIIKDVAGSDIAAPASGVIAKELKSSV